ncbi:MAG: hypothetical protein H7A52_11435 [Akkermansiaceae bacterium]|nr:hypothetical protein [Akkermansiaceae bacterium]
MVDFLKQIDHEAPENGLSPHGHHRFSTTSTEGQKLVMAVTAACQGAWSRAHRSVLHPDLFIVDEPSRLRFFQATWTEEPITEGSFTSIRDLEQTIESYLSEQDENPKRYVWKAEGQEILAKIHRARTAMNQSPGYV